MFRYVSVVLLLMIPAILALGHDLYVNFYVEQMENDFRLSDYGYILQRYFPEEHMELRQYTPVVYEPYMTYMLQQKAVIVGVFYGLAMPFILAGQLLLLRLIFGGSSHKFGVPMPDRDELLGRKATTKYKYKRR
ncbi:MAG: hypothetical protein L6Q57_03325 [Alphaproteobacteria bacterium]|nr:hypothetical protein [Alphaproteobacteria bacterium]